MNTFYVWASSHKVELAGTLFGFIYIWFSIRQNLLTWPAGIISSILFCWVFFVIRLYAQAALQLYYVLISIYGWWSWHHLVHNDDSDKHLGVTSTSGQLWIKLILINFILTFSIFFFTSRYTDDMLPVGDSFIASMSIIATWMLARKKIEQWLIWVFIDVISSALYLFRGLYATFFLFMVYAIMAGIGFYEWKKEPHKLAC